MAYISFSRINGLDAASHSRLAAPTTDPTPSIDDRLTALEWSVVAIARRDRRSSLDRPGWFAKAMRIVFGTRNPMLADPRLESLRRMAVLTWHHGYTVPGHEVRAFLGAGFTPRQYETMVDNISAARVVAPRTVVA